MALENHIPDPGVPTVEVRACLVEEDFVATVVELDHARELRDPAHWTKVEDDEGRPWVFNDDVLGRHSELLEAAKMNEAAWLVERGGPGQVVYLSVHESGYRIWTSEVDEALRLCRRVDAERLVDGWDLPADCRATQHVWVGEPPDDFTVRLRESMAESMARAKAAQEESMQRLGRKLAVDPPPPIPLTGPGPTEPLVPLPPPTSVPGRVRCGKLFGGYGGEGRQSCLRPPGHSERCGSRSDGRADLSEYDPLSDEEDVWVPVRNQCMGCQAGWEFTGDGLSHLVRDGYPHERVRCTADRYLSTEERLVEARRTWRERFKERVSFMKRLLGGS